MKPIQSTKTLIIACFAIIFMTAGTMNLHANNLSQKNQKHQVSPLLTVKEQIAAAQKAGNAVFLVITGTGAKGLTELVAVANQANKKAKKSTVIQMNRDDAANSELVTKYGLATIAVPFVLVISPKGLAVGGYPAEQATSDALVKLIPSPKYDVVLAAVNDKKPVFIVASKKTFTDKKNAVALCKTAAIKVPNTPVIVEVDMNDANESAFLNQIGVNMLSTGTVIVVVNAAGNITGNFSGTQTAQTLADAAGKVIKSCCPSGAKSGCAPKN